MKIFLFPAILFFLVSSAAWGAVDNPYKTEFFEAAKTYVDKDYALNDVVEFSIFDMSEVKFINELDDATLEKTKNALMTLPKLFYQNLKKAVFSELVPVTLYPSDAPAHTKPLKLAIKIKSIELKPITGEERELPTPSVSLRMYGQIEDKKTGEVLLKFYDSGSEVFSTDSEDAGVIYDKISAKIMKNLALFLKSKY